MLMGAAYIRVSTDDQLELSPDSQLKKIQEYALSHDIILSKECIFMEDEGRSGRNALKRPEFQRMIGLAKTSPKPFDVILVWKYSRFARNREDSVVYKSMLRKQCKIDVVSVSENIGDDKMSVLIEAIIEAMDEYYSINLAGEVLRGMTEKAERGGLVGSPAYGYRAENGKLVPVEEQARVVRLIFDDFVNGAGYYTIASKLNQMGLKTKKGGLWENRVIEYLLHNPAYIGKIRWSPNGHIDRDFDKEGVIIANGEHEPLISTELFEKAQERITEISRKHKKYQRDPHPKGCMLQGLVRCSNCGSTLVRTGSGLQCYSYAHGKCDKSHYVSLSRIDPAVIQQIEDDFESGKFHLEVREPKASKSTEMTARQLERAHEKLARAKDAYEAGVYSLSDFKDSRDKIEKEIARLELLSVKKPAPSIQNMRTEFLNKHQGAIKTLKYSNLTDEEKSGLLQGFIGKIVYNRAHDKISIFYQM